MSAKIQIVLFFYFVFWDKKFLFLLLLMLEHSTSVALASTSHTKEAVSLVESYPAVPLTVDGVIFGFEAVQAYQEEHGNLKFSQSDLPLG